MDLVDLKDYFIPSYFQDKGWEKLLDDLPRVCEPLIWEFYSNAILRKDEIDYWIRGHEFTIDVEDIDDVLGFEDLEHDFAHFKDRLVSIERFNLMLVVLKKSHVGGVKEARCPNTTAFPSNLRCLTYIIMFNLYPVKKMTIINNARAIYLMELWENPNIDISAHAFSIIANETRTTSKAKLILPSLLMRIFCAKGGEIPQDINHMLTPPAINALTITRIKVRLQGDEEEGDLAQGESMDTKTKAEGQPSTSQSHGKRSRTLSSTVPLDDFQIILERIDGFREVQIEHSDRMTTIQDQINLLTAKFDSFTN